jgi:hypothetical protein
VPLLVQKVFVQALLSASSGLFVYVQMQKASRRGADCSRLRKR